MPPLKQFDTRASGAPLTTAKQIVTSLLQRAGPMPPASMAFVGALGSCIDPSEYPHPVAARNVGLVPAWLDWTVHEEATAGSYFGADQHIADPRYRFDECAKVIEQAISIDPVWENMIRKARPRHEPDWALTWSHRH